MKYDKTLILILGTLLVSFGGGLFGVYMFKNNYPLATVGFVFSVAGYRLKQIYFVEVDKSLRTYFLEGNHRLKNLAWRYGMLTGGILLCSYGFLLGARSTVNLAPSGLLFSGFLIVTGYILGHIAIDGGII